jgi:hypothetical protein
VANGSFYGFALLIVPAVIACQSVAPSRPSEERYLVTAIPINVGEGIKLCVAIDPDDQQGIWWWTSGETGCASRSSGPAPFRPEGASVSRTAPGSTSIGFRLGTHSSARPFIDVGLIVEHATMRSLESQDTVSIQRRRDLDVPEMPMRGREVP